MNRWLNDFLTMSADFIGVAASRRDRNLDLLSLLFDYSHFLVQIVIQDDFCHKVTVTCNIWYRFEEYRLRLWLSRVYNEI